MEFKQIQELVRLINKTDISELKIEQGEFKISIRSREYTSAIAQSKTVPAAVAVPTGVAAPMAPPAPAPVAADATETPAKTEAPKADSNNGAIEMKSPMVGTFYRRPSPDKEAFVKVGDVVEKGDTLCVIEAMKLFNEIESEISGTIVKVLAEDSSPVEYDQPLFLIEPNA